MDGHVLSNHKSNKINEVLVLYTTETYYTEKFYYPVEVTVLYKSSCAKRGYTLSVLYLLVHNTSRNLNEGVIQISELLECISFQVVF